MSYSSISQSLIILAITLLYACASSHHSETLLSTQPSKQSSQFNASKVKTKQPLLKSIYQKPQPKSSPSEKIYHTVLVGESLANIAKRYGYTEKEIGILNGIYPPYTIIPGETLVIPSRKPIIIRGDNYEAIPVIISPSPQPEQLKNK